MFGSQQDCHEPKSLAHGKDYRSVQIYKVPSSEPISCTQPCLAQASGGREPLSNLRWVIVICSRSMSAIRRHLRRYAGAARAHLDCVSFTCPVLVLKWISKEYQALLLRGAYQSNTTTEMRVDDYGLLTKTKDKAYSLRVPVAVFAQQMPPGLLTGWTRVKNSSRSIQWRDL